jgi:hypothetical protein
LPSMAIRARPLYHLWADWKNLERDRKHGDRRCAELRRRRSKVENCCGSLASAPAWLRSWRIARMGTPRPQNRTPHHPRTGILPLPTVRLLLGTWMPRQRAEAEPPSRLPFFGRHPP